MKKLLVKFIEGYMPQSDEKLIRLNVLLLKEADTNDKSLYNPTKEFCIDFRDNYAYESKDVVAKLRALADKIEDASR